MKAVTMTSHVPVSAALMFGSAAADGGQCIKYFYFKYYS